MRSKSPIRALRKTNKLRLIIALLTSRQIKKMILLANCSILYLYNFTRSVQSQEGSPHPLELPLKTRQFRAAKVTVFPAWKHRDLTIQPPGPSAREQDQRQVEERKQGIGYDAKYCQPGPSLATYKA
jgi:hypothetical protein